MPKFLLKRWHGMHVYWLFALLLVLILTISCFVWQLGVVALVVCGVLATTRFGRNERFARI